VTVGATIAGVGLTKAGNGTLTLTGTNTHSSNFVTGGTLAINSDSNLGTAPVTANTNITLSNGGAIRMLSASAVPGATRIINLGTGGGIFDTNGFDATLTQRIFGGGGLGKRGTGTLTLAPTGTGNDYQGATTLSGGILQAGASNALGNDGASNRLLFNGGTFQATGSFASVNRAIAVTNLGGTIDTQANNLTFGGALTGTGTLTKSGAGSVLVASIDTGGLNITDGRLVTKARTGVPTLAGSNKPVYVNGSLSISATGALDLQDQDLVVTYGTNPSSYADVKTLVFAGFGNTLGGITSSTSTGAQILALFDNGLAGVSEWPGGSGHTISTSSVIGKYTYFGDVNFDGQVTGDDYTVVDANLSTTPTVGLEWLSGDANLDGTVTGDDYTTIDANLGLGTSNPLTPSSLSAVPEPGTLGMLALGATSLLARRRRK
jgi:autotransporter-associated beta strand protein